MFETVSLKHVHSTLKTFLTSSGESKLFTNALVQTYPHWRCDLATVVWRSPWEPGARCWRPGNTAPPWRAECPRWPGHCPTERGVALCQLSLHTPIQTLPLVIVNSSREITMNIDLRHVSVRRILRPLPFVRAHANKDVQVLFFIYILREQRRFDAVTNLSDNACNALPDVTPQQNMVWNRPLWHGRWEIYLARTAHICVMAFVNVKSGSMKLS